MNYHGYVFKYSYQLFGMSCEIIRRLNGTVLEWPAEEL